MSRQSVHDPSKKVIPDLHCDFKMSKPLWDALESYRAEKGAKRVHAVRALLTAALRETGHLPRLKVPQDAAHLEDVKTFPWAHKSAPQLRTLAWFSRDPGALTWATLFDAMENETATSVAEIAARHGMSRFHAQRIFRRFDLWRRGESHRPRLDPFASLRGGEPTKKKRRKKNVKAG